MMAVDINATGSTLQPGTPRVLFDSRYVNLGHPSNYHTYSVAADGQRFLIPRIASYSLTVFDRGGKVVRTLDRGVYTSPAWSPDGTRVAAVKDTRQVWVVDANSGKSIQLAANQPEDVVTGLVWSPDGRQIAFHVRKIDQELIYRVGADGTGTAELVSRLPGFGLSLNDWSPDGRYLIYYSQQLAGNRLFALPVTPEPKPIEIMKSDLPINGARISPDGRLIAYQSTESARVAQARHLHQDAGPRGRQNGRDRAAGEGRPELRNGAGCFVEAGRARAVLPGAQACRDGGGRHGLAGTGGGNAADALQRSRRDQRRAGSRLPVGQRGARRAARRVLGGAEGRVCAGRPDLSTRTARSPGQSAAASRTGRPLRAARALAGRHAHRDEMVRYASLQADDPTSGSSTSPPARPRRSPTTRRQTSLRCGRRTASRSSTCPRARAAIRGFTARPRMERAMRN